MMTLSDVAELTHLGWESVKNIVKADLGRGYASIPMKEVTRIAIDEKHLGKKAKFITLVIDLDSGRILWVGKGRGKDALQGFWQRARNQVQALACDMSAAYWNAVREHLPQAVLVFDKFHAINLFNVKIDEVRRQVQKQAERAGHGPIRGVRYLLLTGSERLDEDKKARLQEALAPN